MVVALSRGSVYGAVVVWLLSEGVVDVVRNVDCGFVFLLGVDVDD
jgi:hypothetical protein